MLLKMFNQFSRGPVTDCLDLRHGQIKLLCQFLKDDPVKDPPGDHLTVTLVVYPLIDQIFYSRPWQVLKHIAAHITTLLKENCNGAA